MLVRSEPLMGTIVTIKTVSAEASSAIDRAFGWFHEIEERCTRFDERSELMQLSRHIGRAVPVSDTLFEAVQFALTVAEETEGAFDPTVGEQMAARGFNREYVTGKVVNSAIHAEPDVSYRDVTLDPDQRTILLRRPLTLDLGAVAKGLAIDTAANELRPSANFSIDAGGDLYLGGRNEQGEPWSVGIRHPRADGELMDRVRVSDKAVCTSGDYERRSGNAHHILDPRIDGTADSVASATVIAPSAILADALATAVFVIGPSNGIALLERLGVEGLIVTPDLERHETRGLRDAR